MANSVDLGCINLRRINIPSFALFIFLLTSLLMPTQIYNKIIFAFMLAFLLWKVWVHSSFDSSRYPAPFVVMAIHIYGFLVGSIKGNVEPALAQAFLMIPLSLLIFYYVKEWGLNIDQHIKVAGAIMVIFSLGVHFYIESLDGGDKALAKLWFAETFEAYSDHRNFTAEDPNDPEGAQSTFRLGSTPVLYVYFLILLMNLRKKFKIIDFLMFVTAGYCIAISGSRGVLFVTLVMGVIIVFFDLNWFWRISLGLVLVFFVIPFAIAFFSSLGYLRASEYSNAVKIDHARSFFDYMNVGTFFFGDGLASKYYTLAANHYVAVTEITPFDFSRYLGVPLVLLLYGTFLFPTTKYEYYTRGGIKYTVIMAGYLIMSFTNPVLFGSIGFIVVNWYWLKILSHNRDY